LRDMSQADIVVTCHVLEVVMDIDEINLFKMRRAYIANNIINNGDYRWLRGKDALFADDAYRAFQASFYDCTDLELLDQWIVANLVAKDISKMAAAIRKRISRGKSKKHSDTFTVELGPDASTEVKRMAAWLDKNKKEIVEQVIKEAYLKLSAERNNGWL
jgi:hypothetical protein